MKITYIGFWRRFAALFIDGIIVGGVGGFVKIGNLQVIVWALEIAYFVWMTGTYGATIGKMVMGIKVVKENGKKLNYSDALLRELSKILSGVVLCLGYLAVVWDPKKQGWHDKLAHTVVVKA